MAPKHSLPLAVLMWHQIRTAKGSECFGPTSSDHFRPLPTTLLDPSGQFRALLGGLRNPSQRQLRVLGIGPKEWSELVRTGRNWSELGLLVAPIVYVSICLSSSGQIGRTSLATRGCSCLSSTFSPSAFAASCLRKDNSSKQTPSHPHSAGPLHARCARRFPSWNHRHVFFSGDWTARERKRSE